MKYLRFTTALLPALVLAAIPARAEVTVAWMGSPSSYLDIGMKTWDREDNMKAIEATLKEFGAKYAPRSSLKFEILDVDLAGRDNLTRRGNIRSMTGNGDYPSVIMQYSVDGGPMEKVTVEDRNFFDQRLNTSEPMYYEKRMFDRWFKERFAGGSK